MNRFAARLWRLIALVGLGSAFLAALDFRGSLIFQWITVATAAALAIGVFWILRRQTAVLQRAKSILAGVDPKSLPRGDAGNDLQQEFERAISLRLDSERAAIDALELERSRLSELLDEMGIGLILVDPQNRVRRANRAACAMFDLASEPKGESLSRLIRDPELLGMVDRQIQGSEQGAPNGKLVERNRTYDVRFAQLSGPPGSRRVLLQFYEISRLEKLEAVRRDFVANVSHELRTPLTSIQAAVETLADRSLSFEESKPFIEMIQRQTGRMGELIEDLIDLAQIETGAVELIPVEILLKELVQEVLDRLQPLATRLDVILINEIPDNFRLHADRRRVDQMLTNLCQNATKFNRPGGSVRVTGGDPSGVIRVIDTGIGIPQEAQERIFNRFYQVESSRSKEAGGTGLGLAITKHLMALHGGRIQLESELGTGATFSLSFPEVPVPSARSIASNSA